VCDRHLPPAARRQVPRYLVNPGAASAGGPVLLGLVEHHRRQPEQGLELRAGQRRRRKTRGRGT